MFKSSCLVQDNVKRRRRRHLRWNKQSKFASWKCIYCVMDSNGGQPGNPETARARAAHQRESNTSVLVLLEMEDFAELQCCGSRLLPLWKKIIATLICVKQQMWWIFYFKKKWRQKERSDPSAAHWQCLDVLRQPLSAVCASLQCVTTGIFIQEHSTPTNCLPLLLTRLLDRRHESITYLFTPFNYMCAPSPCATLSDVFLKEAEFASFCHISDQMWLQSHCCRAVV